MPPPTLPLPKDILSTTVLLLTQEIYSISYFKITYLIKQTYISFCSLFIPFIAFFIIIFFYSRIIPFFFTRKNHRLYTSQCRVVNEMIKTAKEIYFSSVIDDNKRVVKG